MLKKTVLPSRINGSLYQRRRGVLYVLLSSSSVVHLNMPVKEKFCDETLIESPSLISSGLLIYMYMLGAWDMLDKKAGTKTTL